MLYTRVVWSHASHSRAARSAAEQGMVPLAACAMSGRGPTRSPSSAGIAQGAWPSAGMAQGTWPRGTAFEPEGACNVIAGAWRSPSNSTYTHTKFWVPRMVQRNLALRKISVFSFSNYIGEGERGDCRGGRGLVWFGGSAEGGGGVEGGPHAKIAFSFGPAKALSVPTDVAGAPVYMPLKCLSTVCASVDLGVCGHKG